jgi:DNA-binding response OmpR family regulator
MNTLRLARPAGTVLVVDDEASIRSLATRALEGQGYEVLQAADATEAERIADTFSSVIHLLLADIMLPAENGISLARRVVAKRPETTVLYMSGFQPDVIRAVQEGGAPPGGFLEKPFTPEALVKRVRELVEPMEKTIPSTRIASDSLPARLPEDTQTPTSSALQNPDAVYRLESAVRCPQCGESITTLKAVRLLRTQVNFTSTLPRRGRVAVCPCCFTIVPVELTNF